MSKHLLVWTAKFGLVLVIVSGCRQISKNETDGDSQTIADDSDSTSDSDIRTDTDTDSAIDADTTTQIDSDTLRETLLSECRTTNDCRLVNDCCNCMAIGNEQVAPDCELEECFAASCDVHRFSGEQKVDCVAGRCVLNLSCDDRQVTCKRAQPVCPNGQEAVVDPEKNCWTGQCIDATQCAAVSHCEACRPSQPCVEYMDEGGTSYHCVENTQDCEDDLSCNCLGDSVCPEESYDCFDGPQSLSCQCRNC